MNSGDHRFTLGVSFKSLSLCSDYGRVNYLYFKRRYLGGIFFFANEIVLMDELRDDVDEKFERWREAFRIQGQLYWGYMNCNFSGGI